MRLERPRDERHGRIARPAREERGEEALGLGVAPLFDADRAEPETRRLAEERVVEGGAEVFGGLFESPLEAAEDAAHQTPDGGIGGRREQALDASLGGPRAAEPEVGVGEQRMRVCRGRVDLDEAHQVGPRLGEAPRAHEEASEIHARVDEPGVDPEGGLIGLLRFEAAPTPLEGHAEVSVGEREVFVEADRLPEVRLGGLGVAPMEGDDAEVRVRVRETRVVLEGEPEPGLGVVEPSVHEQARPGGVVDHRGAGELGRGAAPDEERGGEAREVEPTHGRLIDLGEGELKEALRGHALLTFEDVHGHGRCGLGRG